MLFRSLFVGRGAAVTIDGGPDDPTSGRPGPTNTGYLNATGYPGSLTTGPDTIASNTTYEFMEFADGTFIGSSENPVSNVTFFGCRFVAVGDVNAALFGDNITFRYCSFEPGGTSTTPVSYTDGYQYGIVASGSYNSFVEQLTVENCDMWGFANGIDAYGSTQAKPHVFRNNWLHDPRDDNDGVDHTDGIGNMSGSGSSHYVVIDNNVIEGIANTNAIAYQGGTYDHMTLTNNLFGGYGYTLSVYASVTNLTFTDNVFSTKYECVFGPLREDWTSYSGTVWQRNKWMVPAGAAWGSPTNDGKFWMPVAGESDNDSTFTSSTDYAG